MAKQGNNVSIQALPLNKIKLGKNSRTAVSKEALEGLMASIKEVGLLQPIGVVKKESGYEVCYGNRRFLACSKLGLTKIPAIVHTANTASDVDIKNLTENIQRRNLSLSEVGRYIELLQKEKLSSAEIAVRLGVTASYVRSCLIAYHEVPEKFRQDLHIASGKDSASKQSVPGKIPISTATEIINAAKSYRLKAKGREFLFQAAKSDDRFNPKLIRKYAGAISSGSEDPIGKIKPMTYARAQFWITKEHSDELEKKYVDDGPFSSLNALFVAILSGKVSQRIKVVEKN